MNCLPARLSLIFTAHLLTSTPGLAQDATDGDKVYGSMKTRWGAQLDPAAPLPEHPRPQMARANWKNLNGQWDYAIAPKDAPQPGSWQGKITVPFCAESQLSGVQRKVGPAKRLWYRRTIPTPKLQADQRAMLHFGAVDWEAKVYVNGIQVGEHRGGYTPFQLDITEVLTESPTQELVVSVWDPTSTGKQPRGKQSTKPQGIFYTPVTGIWQTVWLEIVPRTHISSLVFVPDIDKGEITVLGKIWGQSNFRTLEISASDGGEEVARVSAPYIRRAGGYKAVLKIPGAKLWTPASPQLYDLRVRLVNENGDTQDELTSYAALREVALQKDAAGRPRVALNKQPTFLLGLLDQGWWPDGLYTAPSDAALRFDIEATKAMGFNIARKHVKVEPARWYYWADKLGLLVWQDMPNGRAGGNPILAPERAADPADAEQFQQELAEVVATLENHPSIIIWTIFNEGWGQHDSGRLIKWLRKRDPARITGGPSGWQDHGSGQLLDLHRYPGPAMPAPNGQPERALVLSEFGGLKLVTAEHLWQSKDNWGYVAAKDQAELRNRYQTLCNEMRPLIQAGLCAAIYTQTTDVETEVNGLLTYDRAINKAGAEWLAATNAPLYAESQVTKPNIILNTGTTWSFTTEAPAENWNAPDFDDSGWKKGAAPFGDLKAKARTPWATNRLWVRQHFSLDSPDTANLLLKIHNNDAAKVYLNGKFIRRCGGYSSIYRLTPLGEKGAQALVAGKNTLAIEIENDKHPHFLDAGLIDMRP